MIAGGGYLLDTNIIVALMRANPLGRFIEATYGLRAPLNRGLISVVTVGEMLSLARQFGWGGGKVNALEALLDQLVWIDINDHQILDAYGELDHESLKVGRRIGRNDVWIAATARASGMTLLKPTWTSTTSTAPGSIASGSTRRRARRHE
jgi:tRNA(fMet)-specific endonuclease VapC